MPSTCQKVRTYKKTLSLNEAVEKAVEECIREGILQEFLLANKAEVVAMSIFEYDREWEEEILRKEEFEARERNGKRAWEKNLGENLARKKNGRIQKKRTPPRRLRKNACRSGSSKSISHKCQIHASVQHPGHGPQAVRLPGMEIDIRNLTGKSTENLRKQIRGRNGGNC